MRNECLLCKAFTPRCSTPKAIRILSAETKQPLGFYEEERGENVSWNSTSDVVHFEVFARPDPVNPRLRALRPIIDAWGVDYDVKTNKMTIHPTDN
jgi:hypothetical protein